MVTRNKLMSFFHFDFFKRKKIYVFFFGFLLCVLGMLFDKEYKNTLKLGDMLHM